MAVRMNAYIGFDTNAREAMEFYKSVFGGKLDIQTFKDLHASEDPSEENLVMHSMLEASNGMVLMGSDTPKKRMEYKPGTSISLSISGDTEDDDTLTGYFEKLSDGGTVMQPLEKAMWGDKFGMCTDKFGIQWLINIAGAKK
jgi:PhnB protein